MFGVQNPLVIDKQTTLFKIPDWYRLLSAKIANPSNHKWHSLAIVQIMLFYQCGICSTILTGQTTTTHCVPWSCQLYLSVTKRLSTLTYVDILEPVDDTSSSYGANKLTFKSLQVCEASWVYAKRVNTLCPFISNINVTVFKTSI